MLATLAALALWAGAPTTARAEIDRAALLALSGSVLKIEVLRAQGGFSLGTGVVIALERVVTNCHVTRDAVRINVMHGGVRWAATAQRSDVDRDLCVLRVPELPARPVALDRSEPLSVGEAVTALGYTGGLGLQHSPGEVVALHRYDGGRVIQSSNWFSSGASGGGLFDEQLRLVGILTFRLRGGEEHYFAAPAEWLRALLEAQDDTGERQIAPDRSQRLPYWQRSAPDNPRFLAAAQLQHDDRWPELATLTADWVRSDAGDPEPWYLLAIALEGMHRTPQAQRALECSLALEPAFAAARMRLAMIDRRERAIVPAGGLRATCPAATSEGWTP